MKRFALLLITILAIGTAFAQTTENFTITVTVNFIDFSLRTADDAGAYGTWAIGNMNAGATSTMTGTAGGSHVLVKNESNVALDFKAFSTSEPPPPCGFGFPTAWTAGSAAGTDVYLLEMGDGTLADPPATWTVVDGGGLGDADLIYEAGEGENFRLYSRFTAPNIASDGCEHQITVFIVATTP
ncbi:MAG TPA: hypothetical protein ENN07_00105 [candidate division Zixibacteria bacterium]|nr:hypothetical protein [candidate division Zixibacteria bacterium]